MGVVSGCGLIVVIAEPPLEVDLLQNTLWPETQKLYVCGFVQRASNSVCTLAD